MYFSVRMLCSLCATQNTTAILFPPSIDAGEGQENYKNKKEKKSRLKQKKHRLCDKNNCSP